MASLTKIRGQVSNKSNVVKTLYANQSPAQGTEGQSFQIVYFDENGTPTSSPSLAYNGTDVSINGDFIVKGNVQQSNGSVLSEGLFTSLINTSFANSIGTTTATAGPRLSYRGNNMPAYWTTTFVVRHPSGFNTFTGITGTSPPWITAGADYFAIDGPYISSRDTTTTIVQNGDPEANAEFFPLSAIVSTDPLSNMPNNSKVGRVAIVGRSSNTNQGRVVIGILFIPV